MTNGLPPPLAPAAGGRSARQVGAARVELASAATDVTAGPGPRRRRTGPPRYARGVRAERQGGGAGGMGPARGMRFRKTLVRRHCDWQ